jgi:quinol monooxygenase YgiN
MSKISLIAKLTAADGKAAELEAVLAEVVAAADEEAGLEIYSAHKDTANEGVYFFFEMYSDDQALAVHGKGDGMKAAMSKFGGLLSGRPEITMMSPVVAKGINI